MIYTHDIDSHAAAQSDWALRYEQLSSGDFQGQIEQVQFPQLLALRETTSVSLRQRGRLRARVYGFAMSLDDRDDVFFNGQRVPEHAVMCGKGDEIDLTTPPYFTLIAVIVDVIYTGILKPDARAYQQCMNELGISNPAEIVFVDDQPKNVQG